MLKGILKDFPRKIKRNEAKHMDFTEKFLRREEKYRGKILHVYEDSVLLPDGKEGKREIAAHPGGVAVLARDGEDVLLVEQYRYAFGTVLTELPAGKLEAEEEPAAAAARELREETGAVAEKLIPLGVILPSPGCYTERLWLFAAEGLRFVGAMPDEDEFLRVVRVPFPELLARVLQGELTDAKTVAAVLKYHVLYRMEKG